MLFDHTLCLFGISFHTWTFVVLLATLGVDFICKRKQGMSTHFALVHATALTTFTIHLYELFHTGAEKAYTDFLSPSAWIVNFPFAVIALSVLFYLETPKTVTMGILPIMLTGVTFHIMNITGFFHSGFPKNIWWALSKVLVSITSLTVFATRGGSNTE